LDSSFFGFGLLLLVQTGVTVFFSFVFLWSFFNGGLFCILAPTTHALYRFKEFGSNRNAAFLSLCCHAGSSPFSLRELRPAFGGFSSVPRTH